MKAGPIRVGWMLCLLCVLPGVGIIGYSAQLGPLTVSEPVTKSVTVHSTETSIFQSLTTSATTTGTTTYVSTSTTTKTVKVGGSSPTCPYGGVYRSSICTSLCGCQHDVCVTFDHNCANDYRAVYTYQTVVQTSKMRMIVTSHLVLTNTVTYLLTTESEFYRTTSTVETRVIQLPDPMQQTLTVTGLSLIAMGAIGFLIAIWRSPKQISIAPPRNRK